MWYNYIYTLHNFFYNTLQNLEEQLGNMNF
jgi:hypothetical protein